ncbi:MAG: glycosyltransferase family 2 protein [Oscillospiraceae bacterium]|nr:glycosyltransferase family 2 protein [Oscillospiraceae bacterium]
MKLSVIVPVYNAEAYLRDCVGSLLAQTVDDYELILIDDGSTDRSWELLEAYAGENPDRVVVRHVENGGQGRARNIGIELARGEYLGFVDSDDWVLPEMYAKLLRKAETERADVVVCDIKKIYEDRSTEPLSAWRDDRPIAAAGSACDKLFRRSAVGDVRFSEGTWYEDFAFSAKVLMRAAKTVHIPEMLYMYRCGQPSTMHNNNAIKNLDMLKVMEDLKRFVESGEGERDDYEFLLINHVLLDSISRLAQQDAPERKAVIRRMRDYVRENVPDLNACRSYRQESGKRRAVMRMNYMGGEDAAQLLLKAKKRILG